MDQLPAEIVLHIASFLPAACITRLNIVSSHYRDITADSELWRRLCFNESHSRHARPPFQATGPRSIPERGILDIQRVIARTTSITGPQNASHNPTGAGDSSLSQDDTSSSRVLPSRALPSANTIASWDCTVPGETVKWYSEYKARHARLALDWLPQPDGWYNGVKEKLEVKGIDLLDVDRVLAPLEDGSICIWNINTDSDTYGSLSSRTRVGLLSNCENDHVREKPARGRLLTAGTVECVSIDRHNNKAYFALREVLTEVDLTTMKISASDIYPQPISVLSAAAYSTPLTIGTTTAIHLHDPRVGRHNKSPTTDIKEYMGVETNFHRIYSSDPNPAVLSQPLPLSLLHTRPDLIHVAGRFPSIISYDRRFFPHVASTLHSGARLSCITPIPVMGGLALAAAGEYKGKGSIEIYPLSAHPNTPVQEPIRNRATASACKCLSLASHGNRLLFSDSDGMLKWVERDGSTLVRRWNINTYSSTGNLTEPVLPFTGIFNAELNEGDVARKLLPVNDNADGDVCIWTGEKVGLLTVGKEKRAVAGKKSLDEIDVTERSVSESVSDEENEYARVMRRALERQADETRFVRGLGLGGSF